MQVKNKKKLLGKLYASKLGTILQFWLISKEHYFVDTHGSLEATQAKNCIFF